MTVHLIKLAVGIASIDDLVQRQKDRIAARRGIKGPKLFHVTRMTPKRAEELIDGGSIYWVIKGTVQARQRILAVEAFTNDAGQPRCRIVLDKSLVPTERQPRRAFQGWRYLATDEAPGDIGGTGRVLARIPEPMRSDLMELCLI